MKATDRQVIKDEAEATKREDARLKVAANPYADDYDTKLAAMSAIIAEALSALGSIAQRIKAAQANAAAERAKGE